MNQIFARNLDLAAPKLVRTTEPMTFEELSQREGRKATREFPAVQTELCRIYHDTRQPALPSVRVVEGEHSYTVIESVVRGSEQVSPPPIRALNPEKEIREMDPWQMAEISLGADRDFLDTRLMPALAERLPDVKREDGDDRPTNVFGTDTRYIFNDTAFPWCTTGRVQTPSGAAAGCMIGRNLMLTCSHVMDWQSDGSVGWVKFEPAYYNGPRPQFGTAWGQTVLWWNKAQGGLSDFETAFDYVVVVLDRNLGDLTGYPGYRSYDTGWNGGSFWQHIGYPGDLTGTQRPAFFGNGAISSAANHSTSGQTGRVLGHFMDITGGHSGGPFWGWWGDEAWPRVIGVQSAEANTPAMNTSGDNEGGGGPALSSLITYARANF